MNGRMVTGPEDPVIPPVPHFVMFEGGWEVFGVGTIYPGEGGPHIHYHASVGRSGHALHRMSEGKSHNVSYYRSGYYGIYRSFSTAGIR